MFLSQRTRMKLTTVAITAAIIFAGPGALEASAEEQPLAPVGQTASEALESRSAAIALQPLVAQEATRVRSLALSSASEEFTRTCDRGYGTESWNVQQAVDCAGTVTYYKGSEAQGSINMAAYIASQPPRSTISDLYEGAQGWCSDNSLTCTVVVSVFVAGVQVLLGGIANA